MRKIRIEYVVYCDGCNRDVRVAEVKPNATLKEDEFYFCPDCLAKIRAVLNGTLKPIFLQPDQEVKITEKPDMEEPEVSDESKEVVQEELPEEESDDIMVVKNDDPRVVSGGLNGRYWSPARLGELIEMYRAGCKYDYMAKKFGKTESAMYMLFSRIRKSIPGSDLHPVRRALERIDKEKGIVANQEIRRKNVNDDRDSQVLTAVEKVKNKESIEQIAADLNVSIPTVRNYLRTAANLGLIAHDEAWWKKVISYDVKEQIVNLYNEDKHSIPEIAAKVGLAQSSVYKVLHEARLSGQYVMHKISGRKAIK